MVISENYILVVDDIDPARQTVINILNVLGHKKILEAGNGKEALEHLQSRKDIGLVVSDWKMPVMSGIDLLRWIRNSDEWINLPFFLLTSKNDAEDVALASDLGISGYMVKPLNIQSFKNKLESLTKRSPAADLKIVLEEADRLCEENKFQEALTLLHEFMKKKPGFESRICLEMGLVLEHELRWSEAEKMADRALKINPLMARTWYLKARMQAYQKNWQQALHSIQEAIDISPQNADYRIFQGQAYLAVKEYVQARASFSTAINLSPKNMQIKEVVCQVYLEHDLTSQLINYFEATLFPYLSGETLNNLAVALRKKGLLEDALSMYRQALKKDPNNPKILYNAAAAQDKAGNRSAAIKYLGRALELNPEFQEAANFLSRLTEE